jgi:hypothetical protein
VRSHRVEHGASEIEIEESVDEKRLPIADNEAGIAPAPTAIRLQIRETLIAKFM